MSRDVSRRDLEGKLRQIQGELDEATAAARPAGISIGAAVVLGAVGVAYVIGQHKAKHQTTVVEVRRV